MQNWANFFIDKNYAVMGILNVTPDSFSDGGRFLKADYAVEQGLKLVKAGADIIDIGGESTRPNAEPISVQEEMDRILPVISALTQEGICVSVDTRNAATMGEALRLGARIINDVSALTHDEQSIDIIKDTDCLICLMHMQGTPQIMQKKPNYKNVVMEVYDYLEQRIQACEKAGISRHRLCADVGIGFGKTIDHNLALLQGLAKFKNLRVPLLLGTSRKSFIAALHDHAPPESRLGGSISSILYGYSAGAQIFRVHDVFETVQALKVFAAIENKA